MNHNPLLLLASPSFWDLSKKIGSFHHGGAAPPSPAAPGAASRRGTINREVSRHYLPGRVHREASGADGEGKGGGAGHRRDLQDTWLPADSTLSWLAMLPPVARQPDCWRALKIKIQRAPCRMQLKSEPGGPLYHPTPHPPAPRTASLCCPPAPIAPRPHCLRRGVSALVPSTLDPAPRSAASFLPANLPWGTRFRSQAPVPAVHTLHALHSVCSFCLLRYPLPARERPLFSTTSRPCSPRLSVPLMARPILRADSDRSSGRLGRH